MIPVAVSQRMDMLPTRNETRDGLDQRLNDWLLAAGLLPFPVPNRPALLTEWLARVTPQGIILSGGNDIGRTPERDAVERALLDWAAARQLPALGICRGMQMMAIAAGGTLARITGHVRTRHALHGETVRGDVNSFHAWGLAALPPDYHALATAPDGSIEAMRRVDLPWEGWMWHPEREAEFSLTDLSRLKALWNP